MILKLTSLTLAVALGSGAALQVLPQSVAPVSAFTVPNTILVTGLEEASVHLSAPPFIVSTVLPRAPRPRPRLSFATLKLIETNTLEMASSLSFAGPIRPVQRPKKIEDRVASSIYAKRPVSRPFVRTGMMTGSVLK